MASKVEDQAFVTLVTNDKYAYGALVVGQSLRDVGTTRQLAILVTPQVTQPMRRQLSFVFDYIHEVNPLDSNDEAHLALLTRPELGITFSKIYCWQLTQYSKCVFLDADTLILQNVDDLFDREELSAVADAGWPDCFNSGVFVFRPSNETYRGLLQCAVTQGSFDGGDQGLLNTFFSGWATSDISRHIPFVYNMTSSTSYSYLPAFVRFGNDVKIVHFIGRTKPWMFRYNTQTRVLSPPPDSSVAHDFKYVQTWWNIFLTKVMPRIEQEQQDTVMATTPLPDSKQHPLRELHTPIGPEQGPAMVPTTPQSTTQPLIGGGQHDPDQQVELVSAPLHESQLHPQGDMESSEARAQDTVMATTPLPDSKLHPLRELHEPLGPEQGPAMVPTTPQSTTQPLISGGQHDPDQQVELVSAPLHESQLHPQGDMESSEARADASLALSSVCGTEGGRRQHASRFEDETCGKKQSFTPGITGVGLADSMGELRLSDGSDGQPWSSGSPRASQHAWERGQIDYQGSDSFDSIMSHIHQVISNPNTTIAASPSTSLSSSADNKEAES